MSKEKDEISSGDNSDEERDAWAIPPGLTPDQKLDWEQAKSQNQMARAIRHFERRLSSAERLIETTVKPIVEEEVKWSQTKRNITETVWDSGLGPVKTGPTLVLLAVIVVVAIVARQCGVDPILLSREGRSWWNGECVGAEEASVIPEP